MENTDANRVLNAVSILDRLPQGFRYIAGSARIDGVSANDPSVSDDGATLGYDLGVLPSGARVNVRYVTEVTIGVSGDEAVNTAIATASGGVTSNEATAALRRSEDLFRSKSILMGRVMQGSCNAPPGADLPGQAGIRIYLEDGRYAVSDEGGRFHFEGLNPGAHIVQLDVDTLPEHLELLPCEAHNRFAGRAASQFVDLHPGTLWRADFYLAARPPPVGQLTMGLEAVSPDGKDLLRYTLALAGEGVPVEQLAPMVMLPAGLALVPGSTTLNGNEVAEPQVAGQVLSFALGGRNGEWRDRLSFDARAGHHANGELQTRALARFRIPTGDQRQTDVADSNALRDGISCEEERHTLNLEFGVLVAALSASDRLVLDGLIRGWGDVKGIHITAIGHTDNVRIAPRNTHIYADNYALSRARAMAVIDYLGSRMAIDTGNRSFEGFGADHPVASNDTVEGRSRNRRVELVMTGMRHVGQLSFTIQASEKSQVRADYYGTHEDKQPAPAREPVAQRADAPVLPELESLAPGVDWLWPGPDHSPPIPSLKLAIKHAPDHIVVVALNGAPISPLNFEGTAINQSETVAVSRWRGVDLRDGPNQLRAVVSDSRGEIVSRIAREVHFAGPPVRGELLENRSQLLADGKSKPMLRVRMLDRWSHPARLDTVGAYRVEPPYRSWWEVEALTANQLVAVGNREPVYRVGADGIAEIELEPTTRAGEVELALKYENQREQELRVWLSPAARDWILVGLADATIGYNSVRQNMIAAERAGHEEDYYQDGRLAFFAKGRIKGEFLLTLAFNSDVDEKEAESRLYGAIDPQRFYTLYGDANEQRFEVSSQRRLYLKLERNQFAALFGDYDTGLTVTELGRYSRSFNGLKSEYQGRNLSYTAFAADHAQAFMKDEFQGDGTSGLYPLARQDIVINSDKVVLETRDRFQQDVVLDSRTLQRHLDYNIDYLRGTLFFKQPVPSRDSLFNPVFIVVDYETRGRGGDRPAPAEEWR